MKAQNLQQSPLTYLALGDSYTIGEAVPLRQGFPYQVMQLLRQRGILMAAPEIVATTGWTTAELAAALQEWPFLPQYHFVSLLIGVNNQYRGLPLSAYQQEFESLLQQAIAFAGGKKEAVVVLSIPDYGVTPFGQKMDAAKIAGEIDAFNQAAAYICNQLRVQFFDITTGSRAALKDETLVAADGLHPSAKENKKWAEKISAWALKMLAADKP